MSNRFGFWLLHFNILVICLVLGGAFGVQFVAGELPCPLCILQRMGMMLCALGPVYILAKTRTGHVSDADFARGYGLSVVAALAGASISVRHILLHIMPTDPGYGDPMFGLHLYTWAFVVFCAVVLVSGLNMVFAGALVPRGIRFNRASRAVLTLFAAIVLANAVVVFFESGLHWVLPDDPTRYQLFYDIGLLN